MNSLGAESSLNLSSLSKTLSSLDLTNTDLKEIPIDLPTFTKLATL